MPPTSTRGITQVRRLIGEFTTQGRHVAACLETLPAHVLAAPSGDAGRSVRDVVGELLWTANLTRQVIQQPTTRHPVSLEEYSLRASRTLRDMDASGEFLGSETATRLAQQLHTQLLEIDRIDAADVPPIVASMGASVRAGDFLRHQTTHVVALSDDLQRSAASLDVSVERTSLITAARALAEVAWQRWGGGTIELRVPGAVAVQLEPPGGSGSRHQRGTPPNVVEVAPTAFVRLATGRLSWQLAMDTTQVKASGAHATLQHCLPLMGRTVTLP